MANSKSGEWLCMVSIAVNELDVSQYDLAVDYLALEFIHVSLSKPFTLALWEIEPMREKLRQCVKGMLPFTMRLAGDQFILLKSSSSSVNDQLSFVAMPVTTGKLQINTLIDHIDVALQSFGKEIYFTDRILHASLASTKLLELPQIDGMDYTQQVTAITFNAGHHTFVIQF